LNRALLQLFEKLEVQRTSLLSEIKQLSPEILNKHLPGKWSISQILAHLITAEQLSINYLNKKMQGIQTVENTGLWEEIKTLTLKISQRLPLKFKAPRLVVENTPAFESVEQIEMAWTKTRNELKELLSRIADDQIRRKIYKHPIAGKLNIHQALRFFGEHIIHHQPQIKKLLKQN
jgi:uncharacterized damage-inducible protein DinB